MPVPSLWSVIRSKFEKAPEFNPPYRYRLYWHLSDDVCTRRSQHRGGQHRLRYHRRSAVIGVYVCLWEREREREGGGLDQIKSRCVRECVRNKPRLFSWCFRSFLRQRDLSAPRLRYQSHSSSRCYYSRRCCCYCCYCCCCCYLLGYWFSRGRDEDGMGMTGWLCERHS